MASTSRMDLNIKTMQFTALDTRVWQVRFGAGQGTFPGTSRKTSVSYLVGSVKSCKQGVCRFEQMFPQALMQLSLSCRTGFLVQCLDTSILHPKE